MILQQPFAIFGNKIWTTPLTIDHTKVPSDQSNFPALLNYTDNRFKTTGNGGRINNSSAFDLGFFSDAAGSTPLKWEIERYAGASGEVVAWIKIPTVSSSVDTTFYARYGSRLITTDQSDPTNVWTNGFVSVYHLKDGTTLNVADSRNVNNGTNNGVTATSGQIDGGGSFVSASNQYVDLGTFVRPAAMTFSAWVNATSFPNSYNLILSGEATGGNFASIAAKSTGKLAFSIQSNSVSQGYDGTGSNTLSASTWYYIVAAYDSTNGVAAYVNAGSDKTVSPNGALSTNSEPWNIGRGAINTTLRWNGKIDEARIASVARSANWVTTEYNNQNAPTTFITLGTET